MASSTKTAGSGAETGAGASWSNESYITNCDGTPGSSCGSNVASSLPNSGDSAELYGLSFGFSADIGAKDTINSVQFRMSVAANKSSTYINWAQLRHAGSQIGSAQTGNVTVPSNVSASNCDWRGYDPGNNWGASLTPGIVRASSFGVGAVLTKDSGQSTVKVDCYQLIIDYTQYTGGRVFFAWVSALVAALVCGAPPALLALALILALALGSPRRRQSARRATLIGSEGRVLKYCFRTG